jgi:protein-S-isoprenylcysteine O-methyltransferase Ste14
MKPAFEIGLCNGWLFMIVYPLQWLAVLLFPRRIVERTGHPIDLKQGRRGQIIGKITEIFWIGATLYSVFLPLRPGTPWFYGGLAVFACGLAILIIATIRVARTPAEEPFTRGIYRFSRHPMYLSMIFIYTAVSLAAVSWLFSIITITTFFLQRFQAIQEERYCLEKFGRAYLDYQRRTPRGLGRPKSGYTPSKEF